MALVPEKCSTHGEAISHSPTIRLSHSVTHHEPVGFAP
jgi:hypothetical protein